MIRNFSKYIVTELKIFSNGYIKGWVLHSQFLLILGNIFFMMSNITAIQGHFRDFVITVR